MKKWTYVKHVISSTSYFTEKRISAKLFDSKLSNDEKEGALSWRNILLTQIKSYIDNNINPTEVNVVDLTKNSFTQSLSIKEFQDELEISKDNYYRALSISKDDNLELHLKIHFDVALKAWQANIDI